jgi:hypothetical protein
METPLGNCKYCGKPAGLFRSKHDECEAEYLEREHLIHDGKERISAEVSQAIKGSGDFDELENAICAIEQSSFVPLTERKALLISGCETSVNQLLENGPISPTEESRLVAFKKRFALTEGDLDHNGAYTKVVQSAVLRDLIGGIMPARYSVDGDLPINLQKGEQLVWGFANTRYLEDKVRREYVGGSQGVSVRVMKGLYYRTSAFKGHAVESTETVPIDTGWMFATNKNIYFAGPRKSLRLPYSKVVSFEPFSDGIGVTRDAANAKPQFFVTGEGWFTYNLVTNLSKFTSQGGGGSGPTQDRTDDPTQAHLSAFGKFRAAHDRFVNECPISGRGTIPKQDFTAYMAAVVEFMTAEKSYLESPYASQGDVAKKEYQGAIETFEMARRRLEESASEGRMTTEMFTAYMDALTTFFDASIHFQK